MKYPKFLQEIAHVFGDPLLENTGLEGGQLENALKLMEYFIKNILIKKFPHESARLTKIAQALLECMKYIDLINQDRQKSTENACQQIYKDINSLNANNFIILPGGWLGKSKPGHAMLYILSADHRFSVINTGAGTEYHPKEAQPNATQVHSLGVKLKNKDCLINSGVIPALIQHLLIPADYYNENFLYEVVLKLLEGEIESPEDPKFAYDLQLAGTCFWQCVAMLLFCFYRNQPKLFQAMQLEWERFLLENVFAELKQYINQHDKIPDKDFESAPWKTYFRLIIFSARSFSIKYLKNTSESASVSPQNDFCYLLETLVNFCEAQLERQIVRVNTYSPYSRDTWQINSKFTLFDKEDPKKPDAYIVAPKINMHAQHFNSTLDNVIAYLNKIPNDQLDYEYSSYYIIENLFMKLPFSGSLNWNAFKNILDSPKKIEEVIGKLLLLLKNYYCLERKHFQKPTPEQYTEHVIAIFSVFCFADAIIKQTQMLSFLNDYIPNLSHLINKTNLLELAPLLVVKSPDSAEQLKSICLYLKKISTAKQIFNFDKKTSYMNRWSIDIKHDEQNTEVDFFRKCLKQFKKEDSFYQSAQGKSLNFEFANGIIDSQRQYFPGVIHDWRQIAVFTRLILASMEFDTGKVSNNVWDFFSVHDQQQAKIILTLYGHSIDNVPAWYNFGAYLVKDQAVQWLCDAPLHQLEENQILINAMPLSSVVPRRIFNQLGEIRIAQHVQIYTILELMSQNVHYLQIDAIRFLLEKYLFEVSADIIESGSLLSQEFSHSNDIKKYLLNFMNIAEYYFGGQENQIDVYLSLLRIFIAIESFIVKDGRQLICIMIYDKLLKFLESHELHQAKLSAHMILLYKNYSKTTVTSDTDIMMVHRVLSCWALLLRSKLLNVNFSASIYVLGKMVLLDLQDTIMLVMHHENHMNIIFNAFIKNILRLSVMPDFKWHSVGYGCVAGNEFFINVFNGKVYYKNYPLESLPEEILCNHDYQELNLGKILGVELERYSETIRIYRTSTTPTQLLTCYKPELDQMTSKLLNIFNSNLLHEYTREMKNPLIDDFLRMFQNRVLQNTAIIRVRYKVNSNELMILTNNSLYLAVINNVVQIFIYRLYELNFYPELIYCGDIFKGYFLPAYFDIQTVKVDQYDALKSKLAKPQTEVVIQQELSYRGQVFWAQFLPQWRLDGLLPASILANHNSWIACAVAPTTDFMEVDDKQSIDLSGKVKTIYTYDCKQQIRMIFNLFENNKIRLWKLKSDGEVDSEWVDLLNLPSNSALVKCTYLLHKFELPTYLMAWKDKSNTVKIELPRHQLDFIYHSSTDTLVAVQFNDYIVSEKALKGVPQFPYQLILTNPQGETIVILPNATFMPHPNANKDPLHGQVSSCLLNLGTPSYFVYEYLEDTQQLKAGPTNAEQYLALLYAKNLNYLSCYRHILGCWTDQLLTVEQWNLFLRFFSDTELDAHPDIHACRLQYFLLFAPLFTILYERRSANDALTEQEKIQLIEYGDLLKIILGDYKKYLNKLCYSRKHLLLSISAEKSLYNLCKVWNCILPQVVINRFAVLLNPDQAELQTPDYNIPQSLYEFDEIASQPLLSIDGIGYFQLDSLPIDCFGYNGDRIFSASQCFHFLYKGYFEGKFSKPAYKVALRSLYWNNGLFSNKNNETLLIQILYRLCFYNPSNLPTPFPGGNNIFSMNNNLNLTNESKQHAIWFQGLLTYISKHVPVEVKINRPNISIHLKSKRVVFDFSIPGSNLLPNNVVDSLSKSQKREFSPDLASFKEQYGFDPNWPLESYFSHFFLNESVKLPVIPFPLTPSLQDETEYKKLLHESEFGAHLLEYFRKDYDKYMSKIKNRVKLKPQSNFELTAVQIIIGNFHKLQEIQKRLIEQIVGLANNFPVKGDVIKKFKQLANLDELLTLSELLTLFSKGDLNAYAKRNSYLTLRDLQALHQDILSYLLISNVIKQLKRVLTLTRNLKAITNEKEKESVVKLIGKECYQHRHYSIPDKQLYLLFEYHTNCLLWEEQILAIEHLLKPLFKHQVEQLNMGFGKTSKVAPFVGYILADGDRLMMFTVPSSLVAIFVQLLRNQFTGPFFKRVHVLSFNRSTLLTPALCNYYLDKIQNIIRDKDVLVVTPDVPNSILLKWVELSQQLYHGNSQQREELGSIEKILCLFDSNTTQLIEELDLVLAPLKSELNFTEGLPQGLQPAPERWTYPQQILLMMLTHAEMKPLIETAIKQHDCKSHGTHHNFQFGMIELVNVDYYHNTIKYKLAQLILKEHFGIKFPMNNESLIIYAYLVGDPAVKLPNGIIIYSDVIDALMNTKCVEEATKENLTLLLQQNSMQEIHQSRKCYFIKDVKLYIMSIHPIIASMISDQVMNIHKENEITCAKLVLAKEWLSSILPHVLQKRLHIYFGPYFDLVRNKHNAFRKKRSLHKMLAIPYLGKDMPNRRSEFQNSEIVIAFTSLQYYYLGLTYKEFKELVQFLQKIMKSQSSTPIYLRKVITMFRGWQGNAGADIVELHQVNVDDKRHAKQLYIKVSQNMEMIRYFLDNIVFPRQLKVYPRKLTSNSFDLAGMLFDVTKGFSGTFHNPLCLPENLSIRFQEGVDGSMLYNLNLPWNQTIISVDFQSDEELLSQIDLNVYRMLIDAGGLIQYLSNLEVAEFLLSRAPSFIQGVIFVDNGLQEIQYVLLRSRKIQLSNECNISPKYLFKYIDHGHTIGIDMSQYIIDGGLISLNAQSNLCRLFQGARRLRKLSSEQDQTIAILLRKADVKQIQRLLGLTLHEKLKISHVLMWAFSNTLKEATQELQIASYQRLHVIVRKRSYQLLLGKLCLDKLPGNLNEGERLQLREDLYTSGILDKQFRVRNEVKIDKLSEATQLIYGQDLEILRKNLVSLYRYRSKQAENEIVYICLEAFSEKFHYGILHMLSLEICKYTSDQLINFQKELKDIFSSILLSVDVEKLGSVVEHVQQLLPKWTATKELHQEVQRERDQSVQISSLTQEQQKQNESEKVKVQQQERQGYNMTLFTASPRIRWNYKTFISTPVQSLMVKKLHSVSNDSMLRLVSVGDCLTMPFSRNLMVTENFFRTEINTPCFKGFCKNIQVYFEAQEANQCFIILMSMHEVEYVKECLKSNFLEPKSCALRLLSGVVVGRTASFKEHPISDEMQVQLLFLNGVTESEMPSHLTTAWQDWKSQLNQSILVEVERNIHSALVI